MNSLCLGGWEFEFKWMVQRKGTGPNVWPDQYGDKFPAKLEIEDSLEEEYDPPQQMIQMIQILHSIVRGLERPLIDMVFGG